jgi:hypothetical protein
VIAMHLVEETVVAAPPRLIGLAGTLQKAEQLLGSAVAHARAFDRDYRDRSGTRRTS